MNENSIWKRAQTIELMVSNDILQGFNIGFDKGIPKEVEKELKNAELKQLSDAFKNGKLPHAARLVMAAKAGIGWSTGAHTALPVLTTASGKMAEKFTGFYENTDISNRLKEILK